MKKTKFLIIHPNKSSFYGIDYINSKFLQSVLNRIGYKIISFEEKEYLKSLHHFLTGSVLKKIFILLLFSFFFLKYKLLKFNYTIAFNAKTILDYGFLINKNYSNLFFNILNIKTILKWDHMDLQIPLIKKTFEENYNCKDVSFDFRQNCYNFTNFKFQKKTFNKFKINKLENLNFYFILKYIKKKKYKKKKNLCLCGYLNFDIQINYKKRLIFNKLYSSGENSLKIFKKFINKKYQNKFDSKLKLIELNDEFYEFKKRKIMKNINRIEFVGKELNRNKIVFRNIKKHHNYAEFLKKVANEYKFVINPVNPNTTVKTFKLLTIFYYGGYCLEEENKQFQQFIFLKKYNNFIYYKNEIDLKSKIKLLKKNNDLYYKIKNEIKNFAEQVVNTSNESFLKKFL